MSIPTLSQIEGANWNHLTTTAAAWTNLANTWEAAFAEIRDASGSPGGTPWTGGGATALQQRAAADVVKVRAAADMLRTAAEIATRGAETQQANRRLVLDAVEDAKRENFLVGEDYSVTDTYTHYTSAAEQTGRQQAAQRHSEFITSRVSNLINNENEISRNLTTATAGLGELSFPEDGADGGSGRVVLVDDVRRDPTINGPAATPQHEQDGYDLQNGWINSLQRVGDVGLPGDRESQLISLTGGGYMLVGATNGGPVSAITASTPQGLIGAAPQPLLTQRDLPTVYGPTVMGMSLDPVTGVETIQLRVSTWPPGPIYDPNTWTTTFEVQH